MIFSDAVGRESKRWRRFGVFLTGTASSGGATPTDETPNPFAFTPQNDVGTGTLRTSNTITPTGFDVPLVISIDNGEYSINGGPWVATPGNLILGQTVTVRHTSNAAPGQTQTTTLTIGGVSATFTSTTATDMTPAAFSFVTQSGTERSVLATAAAITPSGYDSPTAISITNGEYELDGNGTWLTAPGTITPGTSVRVRHTSSSSYTTSVVTTLTIGGISGTFTTTTRAQDSTPDAFGFVDQSSVATSSVVTSLPITIAGLLDPAAITITGGEYEKNNSGIWTTSAGTVVNDDTIRVRHTASASNSTATNTVLTIGGVSDTFTSTTAAAITPLTAPTLTRTSTTGTNPMSWSASYTGVIQDRDTIELQWQINGGVWSNEFHLVTSEDQITGGWVWSTFASTAFPASSVVNVRERMVRDRGTGSEAIGAWSNTITDTMAGAAWSPASLFASGEYGFILDPADSSKNFTDAGVTLAAADAQVGQINDLSPNNNHFTATGTGKPIRRNVGGRWYLEFDGVDDIIKRSNAGLYNAGAMTLIFAVETPNTADLGVVFGERSSSSTNPLYTPFTEVSAAGNRRLWIKNDAGTTIKNSPSTSVSPFDGSWNLAMLEDTGAAVIIERTTAAGAVGNSGAGTTYTRAGTLTMNRSSFGGTTSTTDGNYINCLVGRVFAIGRLLTSAEKTQVKQWVAATSGITLP